MGRAIRDDDGGLRLACLRAAIEIRSGSTTNEMLLETATLFHAFVTGPRDGDRAGNASVERSAERSAEQTAERTTLKLKRN